MNCMTADKLLEFLYSLFFIFIGIWFGWVLWGRYGVHDFRENIHILTRRIRELEERLCPNQIHDYIELDKRVVTGDSPDELRTVRKLVCIRCGKEIEKYDGE